MLSKPELNPPLRPAASPEYEAAPPVLKKPEVKPLEIEPPVAKLEKPEIPKRSAPPMAVLKKPEEKSLVFSKPELPLPELLKPEFVRPVSVAEPKPVFTLPEFHRPVLESPEFSLPVL